MRKPTIKELGIDLQKTHSENTFKILYDTLKRTVENHYLLYGNSLELIKDCYNETMIVIWNDIDKYDVNTYSISTMIFMKMTQRIENMTNPNRISKKRSQENNLKDISDPNVLSDLFSHSEEYSFNLEDEYIESESKQNMWMELKGIIGKDKDGINEHNYNILYDKYVNNLSTKELAKKHNINEQIILNRLFNTKRKLKPLYKSIYNEHIN